MRIQELLTEQIIKLRGLTPSEKSLSWIEKINSKFPANPIHPENRYIEIENGDQTSFVQFKLRPLPDDVVEISWIQASPSRQGAGTKVIKMLQDLAQQDGISLTLNTWDKGNMNPRTLTKYYKKQGFKNNGIRGLKWNPNS